MSESPVDPAKELQEKISAIVAQNQELRQQYELKCIRSEQIKKIMAEKERRLQSELRRAADYEKRLADLNNAIQAQSAMTHKDDPFAAKYFELIHDQITECNKVSKVNMAKAVAIINHLEDKQITLEEHRAKAEWLGQLKRQKDELAALEKDLADCQERLREKQKHYQSTVAHLKKCQQHSLTNWVVKLCKYSADNANLNKKIKHLKSINAKLEKEKQNSADTSFNTQNASFDEEQQQAAPQVTASPHPTGLPQAANSPPPQATVLPQAAKSPPPQATVLPQSTGSPQVAKSPPPPKKQVSFAEPEVPKFVENVVEKHQENIPTPDSGIVEMIKPRSRFFSESTLAPIQEEVEMEEENEDEVASVSMNMSRDFNYGQHDSPPRGDGFNFFNSNPKTPNQFLIPEQEPTGNAVETSGFNFSCDKTSSQFLIPEQERTGDAVETSGFNLFNSNAKTPDQFSIPEQERTGDGVEAAGFNFFSVDSKNNSESQIFGFFGNGISDEPANENNGGGGDSNNGFEFNFGGLGEGDDDDNDGMPFQFK